LCATGTERAWAAGAVFLRGAVAKCGCDAVVTCAVVTCAVVLLGVALCAAVFVPRSLPKRCDAAFLVAVRATLGRAALCTTLGRAAVRAVVDE
jgi:hypothetical protein